LNTLAMSWRLPRPIVDIALRRAFCDQSYSLEPRVYRWRRRYRESLRGV
jgi:hypothetical protein